MPLADYGAYIAALDQQRDAANFVTGTSTGRPFRLSAIYRAIQPLPATPTTSAALNRNSDMAITPLPNVASGRLSIVGARINTNGVTGAALVLVDLLNQSGGLDGTLATAQTTGLPTAALTRYTNGEGVMVGLVIYVATGATSTTVTISYTNQAGTPGRISPATLFGGSLTNQVASLIPIPLADGDTGVRSVESVTLAGTTGTAGNFGVVMFKPLATLCCNSFDGSMVFDAVSTGGFIGALAEVNPDACLSVIGTFASGQSFAGSILLAEV